jgi:polar amino acid transport system substrate-binding protein
MTQPDFKTHLKTLARDGVLRVAINTGNRALVQQDSDILTGVSPALAQRLAGEINARMEPIIYNGAGKVF